MSQHLTEKTILEANRKKKLTQNIIMDTKSASHNNSGYIKDITERLKAHNIRYFYRGMFTDNIVLDILSLMDKFLTKSNSPTKVKKKIYNVMAECLQNITRHQVITENAPIKNSSLMAIQYLQKRYFISTVNIIENKNIATVRERIEEINNMNKDQLRSLYKQRLTNGNISEKGGAGLGFIDMARKTDNNLAYKFLPITDEISYFYFRLEVYTEKKFPDNYKSLQDEYALDYLEQIHELTNTYNVNFTFNDTLNILKAHKAL